MNALDLSNVMNDYSFINPPPAANPYYRKKTGQKVFAGEIVLIQYGLLTSILTLGVASNGKLFQTKIGVATLDISDMNFNVKVGDYFIIDDKNRVTFTNGSQMKSDYVPEHLVIDTVKRVLCEAIDKKRGIDNVTDV